MSKKQTFLLDNGFSLFDHHGKRKSDLHMWHHYRKEERKKDEVSYHQMKSIAVPQPDITISISGRELYHQIKRDSRPDIIIYCLVCAQMRWKRGQTTEMEQTHFGTINKRIRECPKKIKEPLFSDFLTFYKNAVCRK